MTTESPISEREREILALVATGATNQQIALQLNISINTVKVHLRNIFGKIGVVSRTEATVYALRHGLVPITHATIVPTAAPRSAGLASALSDPTLPTVLAADPPQAVTLTPPLTPDRVAAPAPDQSPPEPEPEPDPSPLSAPAEPTAAFPAPSPLSAPAEPEPEPAPSPLSASAAPAPAVAFPAPSPLSAPAPAQRQQTWLRNWLPFLILFTLFASGLLIWSRIRPTAPQIIGITTTGPADTVIGSVTAPRWTNHAVWPSPRDHAAAAAFDLQREIYVFGGATNAGVSASVDRYDPHNDVWVALGEKPTPVQHAGAAVLRGRIFLPGGEDANGNVRDLLEIYDPRERTWSNGPALPAPRSRYTLVAWDGQIYLIGGWDGNQIRSEVFIFDPDAYRWQEGPALPTPRQHAGAVIASGRLYLVGGTAPTGPLRDSVRLDPGSDDERRWAALAPLPQAIAQPAMVATTGNLLVFDSISHTGFQYNQTSDVWQPFSLPDEATLASSAVMFENAVYFIAGASAPQPGALGRYQMIFTILLP